MASIVAIVDYGLGNLGSVAGAVNRLGFHPVITHDAVELEAADRLILPGVGAFGDGMAKLRERGLPAVLGRLVHELKKPILGICLGCQLFARKSFEYGEHDGLGWVDAEVVPIVPSDPGLRVPHVGWNDLNRVRESVLFDSLPPSAVVYYVHSFHVAFRTQDAVTATADYGGTLVAAYQRDNIYATQFHPEKSQQSGLTILKNFLCQT
jgi:glutamine amidotransferase